MSAQSPELTAAVNEVSATEQEFAAAMAVFKAACLRNDAARLNKATEAAHAALQGHLDATASSFAVVRRMLGQ